MGNKKEMAHAISSVCKKLVFDRLAEVKGAVKTNKPDPSAYRWYDRVRFVQ